MPVSGIHDRKSRMYGSPTEAFGDDGVGERFKLNVNVKILTKTQACIKKYNNSSSPNACVGDP